MRKIALALAKNSARALLTHSAWFEPMVPTLYVTPMCNLRCSYCEDFGAHRNGEYKTDVLPLADLQRLVEMLAEESDALCFTGGETTLRADLAEILRHARRRGVRYLVLNTNGTLLRERTEILGLVTNLVVSLDSPELGRHDSTLAQDASAVSEMVDTLRWTAAQQARQGFTLTVATVIVPGLVDHARRVMELCFEIGAQFSPQYLSVGRLPSTELRSDPAFPALVQDLLAAKRAGKPVSGSEMYLKHMLSPKPFRCVPTVTPHVDWRGRLAYPCRELPDHVLVDMLSAGSFRTAFEEAVRRFGPPPTSCDRCGERCYVEFSVLLRQPWVMAGELLYYFREAARIRRGRSGDQPEDPSAYRL